MRLALLCLIAALMAASCASPRPSLPAAPTGDIAFTAHELYPEGVAYDASTGGFFVSSLRYGTVGRVLPDGTYHPFAAAGPLVSTQGIAVDAARGRLLVAGGDLGVGVRSSPETERRQAGLAVYDLGTGALTAVVPLDGFLPGPHHANDVALGPDGAAYVTDSFAGAVHRVAPDGTASVFFHDATLAGEDVGLNGVAVYPDGFLLVAHSARGALYRVPLAAPRRAEPVLLPETLVGADGLVLADAQTLALVQNEGADRTVFLRSADGWRSATLTAAISSTLPFPTTAALAGDAVFVLNAKLDEIFDPEASRSSGFLLQRVPIPER